MLKIPAASQNWKIAAVCVAQTTRAAKFRVASEAGSKQNTPPDSKEPNRSSWKQAVFLCQFQKTAGRGGQELGQNTKHATRCAHKMHRYG